MRAPGGHVMQSTAWARIREAQGWRATYLDAAPHGLALVLWRPLPLGRRMAYVPRGPIFRGGRDELAAMLERLAELLRREPALFMRVDPEVGEDVRDVLVSNGWRRAPDIQPVLATLELDLTPTEDALLAGLEKDTRWSVRQAEKRGIAMREGTSDADLRAFFDIYSVTGRRAGFITRTWDYYRLVWRTLIDAGHAKLLLAEDGAAAVAGAMTWHCGDRELYMYGGIPVDPSDERDPMHGPYHFKKGFGGAEKRFVGAHDLVPRELPYRAFNLLEPMYARALRLARR
ncbi:MAG: peptidoglycan bridge formation glycyltransferase FemA/FemB family protein [Chloroflexi bacterium]|nr:peptidoglycan bridge formation glycyltransferase FemA/FemB family protein [Chloroflexota bacterium]